MIIKRSFFKRPTLEVAESLIGCMLVSNIGSIVTSGIIIETEAYLGKIDKAAHSYKGKSDRVRVLYGDKGYAYIYLIYGMHWCLNFSSGTAGEPECVLIRALEPVDGIDTMYNRRNTDKFKNLCSGPGKLCNALGITGEEYGCDLCSYESPLYLLEKEQTFDIEHSKRIGIDYAEEARDFLWRFSAKNNDLCSK